jgi:hypothetical protein
VRDRNGNGKPHTRGPQAALPVNSAHVIRRPSAPAVASCIRPRSSMPRWLYREGPLPCRWSMARCAALSMPTYHANASSSACDDHEWLASVIAVLLPS